MKNETEENLVNLIKLLSADILEKDLKDLNHFLYHREYGYVVAGGK
jgi:hypothetical protein